MPAENRVYLVDSSIYVFRAWFTLPDTITCDQGRPVNAVYGFTDFVAQLLEYTEAESIAFAFDESLTSSHRNEIYPDYKANRESAPDELKHQFKLCREFLRAAGITELGSDRYEADDIIGTLAKTMRGEGLHNTIVTADKDLAQLVENEDLWWDYARGHKLNSRGVQKHFGVRPDQIADMLAIAGDKVDNIPGVPGIGPATAAKLLKKFDSLDNLLDNIDTIGDMKIRGAARLQRLLDEHQDAVRLAKRLTAIYCEVDLPGRLDLGRRRYDEDKLTKLFDGLGFSKARQQRWQKLLG